MLIFERLSFSPENFWAILSLIVGGRRAISWWRSMTRWVEASKFDRLPGEAKWFFGASQETWKAFPFFFGGNICKSATLLSTLDRNWWLTAGTRSLLHQIDMVQVALPWLFEYDLAFLKEKTGCFHSIHFVYCIPLFEGPKLSNAFWSSFYEKAKGKALCKR